MLSRFVIASMRQPYHKIADDNRNALHPFFLDCFKAARCTASEDWGSETVAKVMGEVVTGTNRYRRLSTMKQNIEILSYHGRNSISVTVAL